MPKLEKYSPRDIVDEIEDGRVADQEDLQEISPEELSLKAKTIRGDKLIGKKDDSVRPDELTVRFGANTGKDLGDDAEVWTVDKIEKKQFNKLHGKEYKKRHPEKKAELQRERRKRKREEEGIATTPESTRVWRDPRFAKRQIPEILKKVAIKQEPLMHGWRGEADWPEIENKKKK